MTNYLFLFGQVIFWRFLHRPKDQAEVHCSICKMGSCKSCKLDLTGNIVRVSADSCLKHWFHSACLKIPDNSSLILCPACNGASRYAEKASLVSLVVYGIWDATPKQMSNRDMIYTNPSGEESFHVSEYRKDDLGTRMTIQDPSQQATNTDQNDDSVSLESDATTDVSSAGEQSDSEPSSSQNCGEMPSHSQGDDVLRIDLGEAGSSFGPPFDASAFDEAVSISFAQDFRGNK